MILYSSPLPLRTTAVWAGFREAQPIPHRYGETSGALLQYDDTRRVFVWCDHLAVSIDAVSIDGREVGGWRGFNDVDSTGTAVAFVEFDAPVDEGVDLRARGRGKPSPHHGQLLANPADVLLDVLAVVAGKPVTRGMLDTFRRECEHADLVVGGSLDSDQGTVQSAVREICASVGAAFAPDAAGLAFLHPGGDIVPARETIDLRFGVSADASLETLYNDLTVRYAFDGDEPQATVQLECPASVARHGRRGTTLDARWVTSGRVATAVATRLLQRAGRPSWTVEATGVKRALRIGDGVAFDHPRLPIAGTFRVLARETLPATGVSTLRFEMPAGPVPSVVLVRQSSRIAPRDYASVDVQTVQDERLLFLKEADGSPIAGARVTLLGQYTFITDGAGRVAFPAVLMPRGEYTLEVETLDGRTFAMTVQVG